MRCTFDAALESFPLEGIDLLRLDGLPRKKQFAAISEPARTAGVKFRLELPKARKLHRHLNSRKSNLSYNYSPVGRRIKRPH